MDLRKMDPKELLKLSIGLEDTIDFRCKGCGKCCKPRRDLLFTAMDLHRAGAYLGRTVKELIERYCEVDMGENSHFPMPWVRPVPPNDACPFQRGNKCVLHNAKPTVCAAFPLSRLAGGEEGAGVRYVYTDPKCGIRLDKPVTVKEFLGKNQSEEIDAAASEHGIILNEYTQKLYHIWNGLEPWRIEYLRLAVLNHCFFQMDTKKPLLDEMRRVRKTLPGLLDGILSASKEECVIRHTKLAAELDADV